MKNLALHYSDRCNAGFILKCEGNIFFTSINGVTWREITRKEYLQLKQQPLKTKTTLWQRILNLFIMKTLIILFLLFTATVNATEVYFTPSNDCQEQIIKLIDKAQNNINIAIYSFTDNKIYNKLVKKKNIVKIIADGKQSKGKSSKIGLLSFNNVKVCKRPSGVMHNKYMIIDDKYVITGSYNWSDGARKSNNENCIVISDVDVVKKYQKNFNELSLKYCK